MKHIKLFEEHQDEDDWERQWEVYEDLEDDVESILVDIRDIGLDFSIDYQSGMAETLSISIFDPNDDIFWFNSIIYDRLVFLNDFLKNKYPDIFIQVKDDDLMKYQVFPFEIDKFCDEINTIYVNIYYGE